ncbi:HlyD family type I secretion periplasmic adaptor subunit [Amaricoccus sp.]|uniref:HlyD family type I secretion periplasmic adaptor subunit n=1 Tax=Amaricoccus sp. TaxID=1872485 RepID=UPI001B41B134|nr:HlyD family type I secretion periplasmic adaptor subunit [Amaricoccus sp.]MBP7000900.1 HlyD family type I secretion periplasmic adaptor subunit [Amaricoccus sp.]
MAAVDRAPHESHWNVRGFLVLGYATLFALLGGLVFWGMLTSISGAVIAHGFVEVEGNRQVVQHLTGGVIAAIHVRDGDEVQAGQVLVELEGDQLRTELGIVEGQWYEILARKSRLSAERDVKDVITFDPELVARAAVDPEVAKLMTAQQQQFDARRKVQGEEDSQLKERAAQISNQIDGLIALQAATHTQIELLGREIDAQQTLLNEGLTQLTRLLTPQREFARLKGSESQVEAAISENRGKIAETNIERVRLVSKTREEAIAELRELEFREIELREKRISLKDQISKLQLRAPVSGIVYANTADTLRGVVRPAEPVLYIVPKEVRLIVKARVDTTHIDQVHIGQEAKMRFSAFDQRTTPEVWGHVTKVSADAIEDQQTRTRYYLVEIDITDEARQKLSGLTILPGMPVEAFIQTGERSPIGYLVKPMTDYFAKAFREG